MVSEAVKTKLKAYTDEIAELKTKVADIEESQNFISSKYDELKKDYDTLAKAHRKQKDDLNSANKKIAEIKRTPR